MDITNILDSLGGFLGGGLITGIITWRATVKGAEAEAMAKVQGIYQALTEDLVKEIDRLKTEVELLRQEVSDLSHRAGAACYRRYCVSRMFEEEDNETLGIERHEERTEDRGHDPHGPAAGDDGCLPDR